MDSVYSQFQCIPLPSHGTPSDSQIYHVLDLVEVTLPISSSSSTPSKTNIQNIVKNPTTANKKGIITKDKTLAPPPLLHGQIPSREVKSMESRELQKKSTNLPTTSNLTITAAPKLRDLQKELTFMVPTSVHAKKKMKKNDQGDELQDEYGSFLKDVKSL